MFNSTGKLIYDPDRPGLTEKWWIVLNIPKDIVYYYRWLVKKYTGFILQPPSWGAHISIVKGIKPKNTNLWKKYNLKHIKFTYTNDIRWSGDTMSHQYPYKFWFIDAYSNELLEIRQELGYYNYPNHKFHITIGNLY